MSTNFPNSVDNLTNPTTSDTLASVSHSAQHADANDAIEAIETALLDGAPLHIDDTNERVGIGTTSPRGVLDVNSQADVYLTSNTSQQGTQDTFMGGHVYFTPYGTGNTVYLQARRGDSSGSTEMVLRTSNSGTVADNLKIDSSGRVTAPQQPYFNAYGFDWSTVPSGATVKPPTVTQRNMGSYGYSTSTGRFYPPVDGLYLFGYEAGCFSAGTNAAYWRASLRYNGSGIHDTLSNISYIITGTHDFINLTHIIYITVGNYISVTLDTTYTGLNSYGYQQFYGVLIA